LCVPFVQRFEKCNSGVKQDQPTLNFVVTAFTLHQLL